MSALHYTPDTWRLYSIIDIPACGQKDPVAITQAAIDGGADVIQLRDKVGSQDNIVRVGRLLLPLCQKNEIPLIINDHVDAVDLIGADGLHLGQDDMPIAAARQILGNDKLIGKSTHSLEQALAAESEEVDYIGVGPVYATPTKPTYESVGLELVKKVSQQIGIPFVCIGGIDLSSLDPILYAGGRCVAVVRAICSAQDPKWAARVLRAKLLEPKPHETQTLI